MRNTSDKVGHQMAGDQQDSKRRDLNQEALDEIHGSEKDRKGNEQAARLQQELACLIRDVFFTDDGKRVLAWLDATYKDQLSFDPANPHVTSFNEGERHVVLTIHEMINQAEGEGSVNERP